MDVLVDAQFPLVHDVTSYHLAYTLSTCDRQTLLFLKAKVPGPYLSTAYRLVLGK
jgi:hypothetical protein